VAVETAATGSVSLLRRESVGHHYPVLGPGSVSTVDTQSNRISGSVNLGRPGTDPFDIAVTPAAMYVASQAAGTVTVINPNSSKITASVTVGDSPYGIAVSP
jgi:YVTN family beta-propeller protein